MWELVSYVLTPGVVLTHAVGGGLVFNLLNEGLGRKLVGLLVGFEEVLSLLLWYYLPGSWATICTLAIYIHLYELLIGPRVCVQENAVFLSDGDLLKLLKSYHPDIDHDVDKVENGKTTLHTKFHYVQYRPGQWKTAIQNRDPIDLRMVHSLEAGCNYNIIRAVKSIGAEAKQCFHLKLLRDDVSVTVITPSAHVRDQWLNALLVLIGGRSEELKKAWLRRLYEDGLAAQEGEDENQSGMSLEAAVEVLNKNNRNADRNYLLSIFNTFANGSKSDSEKTLNEDSFGKFYEFAIARPSIKEVYERLLSKSLKDGSLYVPEFHNFLRSEQKELCVDRELAAEWIQQAEPILKNSSALSYIGFTNFLLDEDQSIFNRDHRRVYQSMTEPLSHYYIATSHNTYLTKDQLKGKSSVEAYANALKKGCKCVELDCWDGPNNEPIIYHGHTLTSKILFKDVIQTIKENAFAVSDYPVILSLENHCSIEKQKIMAEYLTDILGDMLYTKPIPESESMLPSPKALSGYILLKNKKITTGDNDDDDVDDDYSDEEMTIDDLDEIETGSKVESGDNEMFKNFRASVLNSKENRKKKREKEKVLSLAQELSNLVVYCQAVHFTSFEHIKEHGKYHQMSSFGEKKAMKFAKEDSSSIIQYNIHQMSRIYPCGSRIDSSNYDPVPLWNVGCQMVALNYQTSNYPMQLNQGLFQDNGTCGYVLKPQFLRQDSTTFDPRSPLEDTHCTFVIIRIISGHQLPYKSESGLKQERSLAVHLKINGIEGDCQKEKSKAVKNNGYNPAWNEVITFKVHVPELALLQVAVKENTDTFLAQYTLPVRSLKQGYRRVPLQNKASEPLPHASLFVHVQIKSLSDST